MKTPVRFACMVFRPNVLPHRLKRDRVAQVNPSRQIVSMQKQQPNSTPQELPVIEAPLANRALRLLGCSVVFSTEDSRIVRCLTESAMRPVTDSPRTFGGSDGETVCEWRRCSPSSARAASSVASGETHQSKCSGRAGIPTPWRRASIVDSEIFGAIKYTPYSCSSSRESTSEHKCVELKVRVHPPNCIRGNANKRT
jgi:hypothetical protein